MTSHGNRNSGAGPLFGRLEHGVMPGREAPQAAGAHDVASYIAEMTSEMAAMATAANLELLAYFLDMARIESELAMRRSEPPPPETPPPAGME